MKKNSNLKTQKARTNSKSEICRCNCVESSKKNQENVYGYNYKSMKKKEGGDLLVREEMTGIACEIMSPNPSESMYGEVHTPVARRAVTECMSTVRKSK